MMMYIGILHMHIRFEGWFEGRLEGGLKHGLKVLQTNTIFVLLEP